MRLIDADALDNALTALRFNEDGELAHWGDRKDWCLHGSEIEKMIADAPTIDAEPVRHGHWVGRSENDTAPFCSVCARTRLGSSLEFVRKYVPYCEYCGSKMDEEAPK